MHMAYGTDFSLPVGDFFDCSRLVMVHVSHCSEWYRLYLMIHNFYAMASSGHVMSHVIPDSDRREQVFLDSKLPVVWKLSCGAIAGAIAQSGQLTNLCIWLTVSAVIQVELLPFLFANTYKLCTGIACVCVGGDVAKDDCSLATSTTRANQRLHVSVSVIIMPLAVCLPVKV